MRLAAMLEAPGFVPTQKAVLRRAVVCAGERLLGEEPQPEAPKNNHISITCVDYAMLAEEVGA